MSSPPDRRLVEPPYPSLNSKSSAFLPWSSEDDSNSQSASSSSHSPLRDFTMRTEKKKCSQDSVEEQEEQEEEEEMEDIDPLQHEDGERRRFEGGVVTSSSGGDLGRDDREANASREQWSWDRLHFGTEEPFSPMESSSVERPLTPPLDIEDQITPRSLSRLDMDEEDDFFQRRASFTLPLMFSLPGDGEGEAWSLWFRTPNGQEFQLIVSSVDLILDVKEKIQRKTGWPVYTSRLICCGKILRDKCTVEKAIQLARDLFGKSSSLFVTAIHINSINELWRVGLNEETDNTPGACTGCACVSIDAGKRVILFGGGTRGGYMDRTHVFDVEEKKWSRMMTKGEIPDPRAAHCMFSWMGNIYVWAGRNQKIFFNDLFRLDLETMQWNRVQTSGREPSGRAASAYCVHDDKLFVYGGYTSSFEPSSEFFMLNLITMIWVPIKLTIERGAMSPDRLAGATLNAYGDRLYLFGGVGRVFQNDMFIFDTGSMRWIKTGIPTGDIPSPRAFHCSLIVNGHLFVHGGKSRQYFDSARLLRLRDLVWESPAIYSHGDPRDRFELLGRRLVKSLLLPARAEHIMARITCSRDLLEENSSTPSESASVDDDVGQVYSTALNNQILIACGDNGDELFGDTHLIDTSFIVP